MRKKKEKTVYYDDGRTIADMSGVRHGLTSRRHSYGKTGASFKEVWKTFWSAFRMMLLPTLVVCGALVVIYAVMTLVFWLA